MPEETTKTQDICKEQIRTLISTVYDMQKMRIATGNRLIQSFYIQLGIKPSTSPSDADKEQKKLIDRVMMDYNKVTDSVAMLISDGGEGKRVTDSTIKKAIKALNAGDTPLDIVHTVADYNLVSMYADLKQAEDKCTKTLDTYVLQHPLWNAFFKDIKGCGTLMSACCIAYLDPYKARHASCFYRYCGLDTVKDKDKDGNYVYLAVDDNYAKLSAIIDLDEGTERYYYLNDDGHASNREYTGAVNFSEHGRSKGDVEMQTYIDKDGNEKEKRGITYNPIIKTKLMGVLTGCLLKAKDPTYSAIYYDYKARLLASPKHKNKSAGQINMMAQRYMIKQFLRNLWVAWRQLEGLEVDEPYEVAKLGNKPHKYNQYQCDVANNRV